MPIIKVSIGKTSSDCDRVELQLAGFPILHELEVVLTDKRTLVIRPSLPHPANRRGEDLNNSAYGRLYDVTSGEGGRVLNEVQLIAELGGQAAFEELLTKLQELSKSTKGKQRG